MLLLLMLRNMELKTYLAFLQAINFPEPQHAMSYVVTGTIIALRGVFSYNILTFIREIRIG
jgi:hypothetical protein